MTRHPGPIVEGPQTPAGETFMFFGEIATTSADGTVATIYNNGPSPGLGYSGTSGITVEGASLGYPDDPEMAQEATNYLLATSLARPGWSCPPQAGRSRPAA